MGVYSTSSTGISDLETAGAGPERSNGRKAAMCFTSFTFIFKPFKP